MAVYFVYRCPYGAPSGKHVCRFEYDTVLDWAQAVFRQFAETDKAYEYAAGLLGGLYVYSFAGMFLIDHGETARDAPRTVDDVGAWFGCMYDQGQANGPHHVQLLTDDDEIEMAVYVFDDHYRAANPGRADFVLRDGWELPPGDAGGAARPLPPTSPIEPSGRGEGVLYCFSSYADDSSNLSDLCPALRIDGLRVPDLARYLLLCPNEDALDSGLNESRDCLRQLLLKPTGEDAGFLAAIRDQPDEQTHWSAYTDWLLERDLPPAGLHLLDRALRDEASKAAQRRREPESNCVNVTAHMAQWFHPGAAPEQFVIFDDRWAAAHPTLAAGILTFAARWDVLT
jgi:uncharacterized protein (TIGR02996 family)